MGELVTIACGAIPRVLMAYLMIACVAGLLTLLAVMSWYRPIFGAMLLVLCAGFVMGGMASRLSLARRFWSIMGGAVHC